MTIQTVRPSTPDAMITAIQQYFIDLSIIPCGYPEWEVQANKIPHLLPSERIFLRFAHKNFTGSFVNRWVVFCESQPNEMHAYTDYGCVMHIEPPGKPGEFATPGPVHLKALDVIIYDWREGAEAALDRIMAAQEAEDAQLDRDHMTAAEGIADDVYHIWKRAMGETGLRLGGEEPLRQDRHFDQGHLKRTPSGLLVPAHILN